jgi:hypothetical protein
MFQASEPSRGHRGRSPEYPDGHIAQQLDGRPPAPTATTGPKSGSCDAHQHLDATFHHLLNDEAVQGTAGRSDALGDRFCRPLDLCGSEDSQGDRADLGLVDDVGAVRLDRDRPADLGRSIRLLGTLRSESSEPFSARSSRAAARPRQPSAILRRPGRAQRR